MASKPIGRKAARARDASGRFLSREAVRAKEQARLERAIASAENGTVYAYNVAGTIRYRNERGYFVPADIAAATRGGAKRVLTAKGERRAMAVPPPSEKVRAPRGTSDAVVALELRAQSFASLVEDAAVNGRDTFIRWRGEVYRVRPGRAAELSDVMRVLVSDYMNDFRKQLGNTKEERARRGRKHSDGPQLTTPLYETSQGDLLDFDRMTLFDEGLEEELQGDKDAEEASMTFQEHAAALFDALASRSRKPKGTTNAKGKKAATGAMRTGRRSPTRRKNSKGRK